jgi:hypothetical protein
VDAVYVVGFYVDAEYVDGLRLMVLMWTMCS